MALKSERFEMRLDEAILDRVDKWRAKQDEIPSRAEAMRRLIEIGLARAGSDVVSFSDGEKLLTIMMRDLYKHLKVNGDVDPDFMGEVLWGGHYWAPRWEMQGLFHDYADDPRDVRFVVDVLDMWTFIERGHQKLSAKDKARVEREAEPFGKHVRFAGFDGNDEAALLGIARFLIEKMKRFSLFRGRDFNSHAPTMGTYSRMLQVFEPMRASLVGKELDAGQIIAIMKAHFGPD